VGGACFGARVCDGPDGGGGNGGGEIGFVSAEGFGVITVGD